MDINYAQTHKNRQSFVKQAAILAMAGICSRILGFLLRIPLSNTIGNEGNGIYGDGYTIYNFFLILSSAGFPAAISKMVSERVILNKREEAHHVFKTALKCASVIGFISALILWFGAKYFAEAMNNTRSYYTLLALAPTVFIVAVMSAFRGYFQGMGSTVPTAVSQLVEQIFNVIFSIVLMLAFMKIELPVTNPYHGDTIAMGAAGGQLGTGVGAFAGLLFISSFYFIMRPLILKGLRRNYNFKKFGITDMSVVRELFRVSIPIIAGTAVFSFSSLIDAAMVKGRLLEASYSETTALAQYGIYIGKFIPMITLPVSISSALATASIPSIAASSILKDKDAVCEKVNTALRVTMFISVPAAIGLGVLADPIFHLIFSNSPDGASLLMFGSISVIFLALSQIATGMLQGIGKIHIPVIAAACGVAVKIPLNYVLCAIPSINIYGAVISTIACYAVSSSINIYQISKTTKTKPDLISIAIKPLIASSAMGLACYVAYYICHSIVSSNAISTIISIICGIVVYFGMMLLINGIDKRDLMMLPFGKKISYYLEHRQLM